ncbi:Gfo/Idh/MocA family oxidoreductase [Aneurinibacillus thermoaerophilus]|uniref:Gfo/Idh/MocA family protein n=1 Tax=Aneurinibacillus thermoaerophilus TaxID=143495 RepID=UPI002E2354BF|nr:Gfo/Idh/MocA family oxidoreductase [Aneurinibacillus thermoaerophilus]MED0759295.1 Gfo/Idh/MocA family oxidoreductase [Aneurinibacillus thermoaerophilus]
MSTISFAIVGCGHIATKHIEAIRNIEQAELAAVCDTNPARIQEYMKKHNVRGYLSLEEMLANEPDLDVVNICTPSGLHAPLAVQAAAAKKHVIVEKPIALTLEDADRIIQACAENNVKLSVVHPNRFRPAVTELKKLIDKGLFGKLSHVNATVRWNRDQSYYDQAAWRGTKAMDGGVLMNQAIHNLDLLYWLAGPVEEVQAYNATRLRNIEAEDVSVAVLRFTDGALGIIEAAATVYPQNYEESLSIFGETGTAVISGRTANWIKHLIFKDIPEKENAKIMEKVEQDPYGTPGHQHIIADMIRAIREDREPLVTGWDGRNALQLVLTIYEAAEKHAPVKWSHHKEVVSTIVRGVY